ncbi:MAG: sugar transferase [Herpetosiphonaceae bacterium]|nr:sugar transferase [Herpetosiphonaceae bacterium]
MLERLVRRLAGSVLLWDILVTLVALRGAASVRLWLIYGNEISRTQALLPWQLYGVVTCVWTTVFLLLVPQRSLFMNTLLEAIGRLVAAVALSVLVFAGVLYLSFRNVSRLQFLYFAGIDIICLLTFHLLVRFAIRFRVQYAKQQRTLIVGSGVQAQLLVRELDRRPWVGMRIVGYTSDEPIDNENLPILGSINDTARIVAEHAIDEVIFVTQQHEQVMHLSLQLVQLPVMLHMVPTILDLTFARTPVETLGGIPVISLRESALTEPQRLLKQLFDKLASALLLVLVSPLMLLIALAIKLESPGPVFFFQERIGEHGKRFRMIKFRSMYADAEQRWQEVMQRDEYGKLQHKRNDDPRVTNIGRRLRRTSLDELPQLFNVLRGEMSLVGPRPEMPYIAREYEPWQWQRFRIPPGMTGWWQVNGRADKLMHLHTEDDLYYIQNYSFWLDLKILWMTVRVVLKGAGAF